MNKLLDAYSSRLSVELGEADSLNCTSTKKDGLSQNIIRGIQQ